MLKTPESCITSRIGSMFLFIQGHLSPHVNDQNKGNSYGRGIPLMNRELYENIKKESDIENLVFSNIRCFIIIVICSGESSTSQRLNPKPFCCYSCQTRLTVFLASFLNLRDPAGFSGSWKPLFVTSSWISALPAV